MTTTQRHCAVLTALCLLAGGALAQTVTGRLSGEVLAGNGEPLPGVTVNAESPVQIGGVQITFTREDGSFAFPRLSPGSYRVTFELDGFASQEHQAVEVRLNRTFELHIELTPVTTSEEIVVTSAVVVIDPEQVSPSMVFTADYLQRTAVGSTNRSYLSIFTQIPGTTSSAGNAQVFGSTVAENSYIIDGIDTTDPVTATFGTQINFDTIQEIAVHTGGYEAEYGRATGGVVNVITKSGGNAFSGTLDYRYRETSFTNEGEHFDPDENKNDQTDLNATFGGPLMKDKLWFFVAAADFDAERTTPGNDVALDVQTEDHMAKLTLQASQSWQVVGKWSDDPAEFANRVRSPADASSAHFASTQGGDIYQATVTGVLTENMFLDLGAGRVEGELAAFPQSGDTTTPAHFDIPTSSLSVNYWNNQARTSARDEFRASLSYFAGDLAGSHDFKFGLESAAMDFNSINNTPGELVFYDDSEVIGPYLFVTFPDSEPVDVEGDLATGYLQDTIRPTSNLTLKVGVRYDQVAYDNDVGTEVADMDKLQPRVGLAYDLGGTGKTILRASAGTFMHPNALTMPSFARAGESASQEVWVSCAWTEIILGLPISFCEPILGPLTSDPVGHDPAGWWLNSIFGGTGEPNQIDPGLDAMYADEFILGIERRLFNHSSIELNFIRKKTKDIFEDTCDGNLPVPVEGHSCDFYVMTNLAGLNREYEGITLLFETRPFDWMHVRAYYAWSESTGNVENTQNAGVDFDYFPGHFVNSQGNLGDDRTNRVRATGYFLLPLNFQIGFDAFWSDKFNYEVLDSCTGLSSVCDAPYGDFYVESRGGRRANSSYSLDLQVTWGVDLGPTRVSLIASVFNATDEERPSLVCERLNGCGDDDLGAPLNYTRPRSFEAGVRLEL